VANRRLAPDNLQPTHFAFTPENEAWAERQIAKYPPGRQASAVIALLWRAQAQAGGWLPQKAIEAVASRLDMPAIRVLEVATFYTMFNLEPVGRHFVQLCGTVPCAIKGAEELKGVLRRRIGEIGEITPDGQLSWLEVECLGACCNAPMVQINDDYYEDLTPETLESLLDDLAAGRPVKAGSQIGRRSSEPEGGPTTLSDAALYDGSLVGAWRKRFEEEAPKVAEAKAEAEKVSTEARVATDTKPAKPQAGRAIESPAVEAPAQRVAAGEPALQPGERAATSDPAKPTVADNVTRSEGVPAPESARSYVQTPSKPEEGRPVAAAPPHEPAATVADTETVARAEEAVIAAALAALPKGASAEEKANAVGTRPASLPSPREGTADDLKRVRGIGPVNERKLNELGIHHFDQIAAWGRAEVRWVGTYLAFPGRIDREAWVEQAKALAGEGA
jgi:NADH-quinone oxidoreductase subunit E